MMTEPTVPLIRVLIADDEAMVRAGLAMLLEGEPDVVVVGEAGDGAAAIDLAGKLKPDVVIMDVRMPGMDGVAATRSLTSDAFIDASGTEASVLILTTFNEDSAVDAALRAGASGFILKNAAPHILTDAVRALARGAGWLDPSVTRRLLTDYAHRPDPALPTPGEMKQLTRREREVMVLVAHGLTNSEIAGRLFLTEATVKTHIGRIFLKLGLHDRAHAVAVAYKTGLVRPGDSPA